MAAAFDRAGFPAVDVHMSDILAGRVNLKDFKGLVACGRLLLRRRARCRARLGQVHPVQRAAARDEFQRFFERGDTFALGVCNGCQMMSDLQSTSSRVPILAALRAQPAPSSFEARFSADGSAGLAHPLFFAGMAGSRMPIAVSHGEGRVEVLDTAPDCAQQRSGAGLRFVDNQGEPTERYPYNPNGSPGGLTAVTTADGRFTIMMPHPERVFRTVARLLAPGQLG